MKTLITSLAFTLFALSSSLFASPKKELKDISLAFPTEELLNRYQKDRYQSHRFGTNKSAEEITALLREFLGQDWVTRKETADEKTARLQREAKAKVLFKGLPQPEVLARSFYVNREFPNLKIHLTITASPVKEKKYTILLAAIEIQ